MKNLFSACCLLVAASAGVSAHDFWLGAADWRPGPGAPATITAGIGEHFPTRTQTRMTETALEEWRKRLQQSLTDCKQRCAELLCP